MDQTCCCRNCSDVFSQRFYVKWIGGVQATLAFLPNGCLDLRKPQCLEKEWLSVFGCAVMSFQSDMYVLFVVFVVPLCWFLLPCDVTRKFLL